MRGSGCAIAAWLVAAQVASAQPPPLAHLKELWSRGRLAEAAEGVEELLRDRPGAPEVLLLEGVLFAETGRGGEAVRIFLELALEHPDWPEPLNNLAVLAARRGEEERAVDLLKRALQTDASYQVSYENLTRLYGELASRAYDRALGGPGAAEPRDPALRLLTRPTAMLTASDDSTAPPEESTEAPRVAAIEPLTVLPEVLPPDLLEPGPAEPLNPAAIVSFVREWAKAWSEQRADDFLGLYAEDFSPRDGSSRAEWSAGARQQILARLFIRVEVDSFAVRPLQDGGAEVVFRQSYWSDASQARVVRVFDLGREDGGWRIRRERVRKE